MKKSISKKMVLPILLASFCSGASAQNNGFQYGNSLTPTFKSQISNQKDSGYSGRTLILSNLSTAIISATASGAVTGQFMENHYAPIVDERFELREKIEELRKSFNSKKADDLQLLKKAVKLADYYKNAFDKLYLEHLTQFNENTQKQLEEIKKRSEEIMKD